MKLLDIIDKKPAGHGKIPWHEPQFSQRMLAEHLSQAHNWASRRSPLIKAQMAWLDAHLPARPAGILDLACGPGLYSQLLAQKGHRCTGVDFSPAAIAHARAMAAQAGFNIAYIHKDLLKFKPKEKFDCILFIFAEFNTFTPAQAMRILGNCARWLNKGGFFLLEAQTWQGVKQHGSQAESWSALRKSLFSDKPHICLQENTWQPPVARNSYYIIDAASGEVSHYASSAIAYRQKQYLAMLRQAGFSKIKILSNKQWPTGQEFEKQLVTFFCQKA